MIPQDKANVATAQMFQAIGRTITRWSMVENSLCNIFTLCVTSCPARPGGDNTFISLMDHAVPEAVFYSVENFRGKLGLTDAALNARITEIGSWAEDLRNEWSELRDKTRKLSLKRNRLAHWTVLPAFQDEEFRDAALLPPFGSPGWWKETSSNPKGQRLKASHIGHLHTAFCLIDDKLRSFAKRLADSERLCDKYDRLTVRLIRSHDRLNATRGERIRRDLASQE